MNEDMQREETARLNRINSERYAADGRQTLERQQAEERQRQEQQQLQDEQCRQDSQRQDIQRREDEYRREEERRRQEHKAQDERRKLETDRREESQRQEREPAREEQIKKEIYRREEKTPQSQQLQDLAHTNDKYERLIKSGYYDEKRAETREKPGQAKTQNETTPVKGGFATRREALKPKIEESLKKQEQSKDLVRTK